MQPQILRFLLDSEAHLRDVDSQHWMRNEDWLQVGERALPDHDWFERGNEPTGRLHKAEELFPSQDLQFDA